ncbi:MAG: U32 family peptidase [Candidatus Lokiarchaeota archaeon]|nr:U32 family peptidase [Candidatus Lokiarchaeota archaeon]
MKNHELLIPVQNQKSLQAVIGYADAIYFGTETFNMRMHARNIKLDDMSEFIKECHENNLKAYLTTNIIIYEGELELLEKYIEEAYHADVDALILHDFATIKLAKKFNIPFHVSTQASISNSAAAIFFEEIGAERIILARELSLKQIYKISKNIKKVKLEAFIHGAMCTSISGRCYFSQVIHESSEFSANRGKCLQPCRDKWKVYHQNGKEFDYDGYFFINAKDLCMIEHIPEMIEAGIYSFKVEGRMRSAQYIEKVARLYRKAFDAYYDGDYTREKAKKWKDALSRVYNRGFSTGFYFNIPTALDISRKTSGNVAKRRKLEVGSVVTYYRRKQVAKLRLYRGKFKIGDVIYIEGGDMGTFYKHKFSDIYHKNKMIQETPDIAQLSKDYLITIKVDQPVNKSDRVFMYIEK